MPWCQSDESCWSGVLLCLRSHDQRIVSDWPAMTSSSLTPWPNLHALVSDWPLGAGAGTWEFEEAELRFRAAARLASGVEPDALEVGPPMRWWLAREAMLIPPPEGFKEGFMPLAPPPKVARGPGAPPTPLLDGAMEVSIPSTPPPRLLLLISIPLLLMMMLPLELLLGRIILLLMLLGPTPLLLGLPRASEVGTRLEW